MSDGEELDRRRKQRFSAFEQQVEQAGLGALQQLEAILVASLTTYTQEAGTPDHNARPLLEACGDYVRATPDDRARLADAIDEQLTVLTPTLLHRVGDVLANASAEYAADDPAVEDEVLVLLARLTAVVNGERQAQQERAGELEAELAELIEDGTDQHERR